MIIKSLTMQGFKQFAELTEIVFDGQRNTIAAANNQGKTTIGEAINYAIAGRDLAGSDKVDDLMCRNCKRMWVRLVVVIDGEERIIERSRDTSKKTAVNMATIDGREAKQTEFAALLGDWRQWMAIFWPPYIHGISDDKAADLLQSLLRPVSDAEILEQMSEQERELLKGHTSLAAPAAIAADLRKEIKAIQDNQHFLSGQIAVLSEQMAEAIPDEKPRLTDRIKELKFKLSGLTRSQGCTPPKDLAPLEREYNLLKRDYQRESENIRQDPTEPVIDEDAVCSACGQKLPLSAAAKVMEQHQRDVVAVRERNAKTRQRLKELTAAALSVVAEIKKAKEFNANLTAPDPNLELMALESELVDVEAADRAAERENALRQEKINRRVQVSSELAKAQQDIANNEADLPRLQDEINALSNVATIRERLMMDQIRPHLVRTDIKLWQLVKSTGEMKPDFSLTFDGQPYKTMSNSNRIRCGLEISNLVRRLTGRQYPTYIDNAESMDEHADIDAQAFFASVAPGLCMTINGIEQGGGNSGEAGKSDS